MDTWQGALDVAGLVPGLGEPADALNGVIWMMRGDCTAAALSFAAMVPVAGWAATAGKAGKRAAKLLPPPKVRGRANPIGQQGPFYGVSQGTLLTPSSLDELSQAARVIDPSDKSRKLTRAGRALAKHSSRPGSVFSGVTGNPETINQIAQDIVDDILTDPGSTIIQRHHKMYGNIIDIRDSQRRGLRFNFEGNLKGFLEP